MAKKDQVKEVAAEAPKEPEAPPAIKPAERTYKATGGIIRDEKDNAILEVCMHDGDRAEMAEFVAAACNAFATARK